MKHPIEAVLFDMDGTIIDNLPILTEGVRLAVKDRLGKEIEVSDILRQAGRSLPDFMSTLLPVSEIYHEDLLQKIREDFEGYYKLNVSEAQTFKGIEACLSELSDGYCLGVVSSRLSGVQADLARLGIGQYFDVAITRQDTEYHKPSPAPLLLASNRLGISPESCVYVGDAVADVQAAKAAGMVSVAAAYGASAINELAAEQPDASASSSYELSSIINKIAAVRRGELS